MKLHRLTSINFILRSSHFFRAAKIIVRQQRKALIAAKVRFSDTMQIKDKINMFASTY